MCIVSGFHLHLILDPSHEDLHDIVHLLIGEGPPWWDGMPLHKAGAAAAARRVLGDEDGMAAHRRLLSVIRDLRRREALDDEVLGVALDRLHSLRRDVSPVRCREMEAHPEW